MPAIGVHCERGNVLYHECAACAQDPLHPCGFPPDLLELMRGDDEPAASAHSPTRIQGCSRQAVLMDRHDYYVDTLFQFPMTRGHMVHALMEKARYPGALAVVRERRLTTTVETKLGAAEFTGKPDIVVIKRLVHDVREGQPEFYYTAKVVDYKSKSAIGHDLTAATTDHQIQVNLYAWLVGREMQHEGYPVVVDELEIVYVDMTKVRRFTTEGHLTTRGKLISRKPREYEMLDLAPIKMKDARWAEGYVKARIQHRLAAREVLPPVLAPDDAWKCDRCPVFDVCTAAALERHERLPGR